MTTTDSVHAQTTHLGWTINNWLSVALVPAGLYAVQNMAALTAYQHLDALTYNTLNQTKTLSAALCCYLVMGRRQSPVQVISLFLLLLSALVMEGIVGVDQLLLGMHKSVPLDTATLTSSLSARLHGRHFTHGVAPILLASFISGLAGALSQKNLQAVGGGRNAYLFSMELCAATCVILLLSLLISNDGEKIAAHGFWNGWTPSTFIPIVTNSAGGIVVGLVTKYAGSVRKGFALIFGIFLSGVIQAVLQPEMQITREHVVGGLIAGVSLYMHAAYPPVSTKATKQD
jgi:solute carrier family 35 (UDP-sugar transporter), member A1/2/3